MISRYVVHNENGEILRTVECGTAESAQQAGPGEHVVPAEMGVTDENSFVKDGEVISREHMGLALERTIIVADCVAEAIISGIPDGVSVRWPDGEDTPVSDGEVRFSVDLPGTYKLAFSGICYLKQEVVIEAHAPD